MRGAVAPGVLSFNATCPAAFPCTRSLASAGRVMLRHGCFSGWRSSAAQCTAACRLNPSISARRPDLLRVQLLKRRGPPLAGALTLALVPCCRHRLWRAPCGWLHRLQQAEARVLIHSRFDPPTPEKPSR